MFPREELDLGDEIRYSFRTRRVSRLVDAAARSKLWGKTIIIKAFSFEGTVSRVNGASDWNLSATKAYGWNIKKGLAASHMIPNTESRDSNERDSAEQCSDGFGWVLAYLWSLRKTRVGFPYMWADTPT